MLNLSKIHNWWVKLRYWQKGAVVGVCLPLVDILFYGLFYSAAILFRLPNAMHGSHNLGMWGDTLVAIQWVVVSVLMIPWLIPIWTTNSLTSIIGVTNTPTYWIIIFVLGLIANGLLGIIVAILMKRVASVK